MSKKPTYAPAYLEMNPAATEKRILDRMLDPVQIEIRQRKRQEQKRVETYKNRLTL